jgi:hypothetical protein
MSPNQINDTEIFAVQVNGGTSVQTSSPGFEEIRGALRGVALSDSPICIQGGDRYSQEKLLEQLHGLSRRSHQPIYKCQRFQDVLPLMDAILKPRGQEVPLGTWVLQNLEQWKPKQRDNLEAVVTTIDNNRLCGRGKHENVPRLVTVQKEEDAMDKLSERLKTRLSFFQISLKEVSPMNAETEEGEMS